MVTVGLYVELQAKSGKEADLEAFLRQGQAMAEQEPATTAWFAVRMGPAAYAIFDVFPDDAGRQAHLSGPIAAALGANASELLKEAPKIQNVDVLASKLP